MAKEYGSIPERGKKTKRQSEIDKQRKQAARARVGLKRQSSSRIAAGSGAVRIVMDSNMSDAKKREALRILGKGKGGPKEG